MGGFMFILGTGAALGLGCALYGAYLRKSFDIPDKYMLYRLTAGFAFALSNAAIGFADDAVKVTKRRNLGLNAKQKLCLQFLLAGGFLLALRLLGDTGTYLYVPFLGRLELGLFYYLLMAPYIVFLTNAVNLTDGIDGLCGSVTVIAALSFVMLCSFMEYWEYSIYAVSVAGACLGFLIWNFHPAKVFMGDTGSMFLGGSRAALGFLTRQHVLLALIGIIYLTEALSVVIQVLYFKATKGKRLFKMSPLHHHFEMSGYTEYKITLTFSIIAVAAGLTACAVYLLDNKILLG
jgi:phospho-N-acetylmuramoyl-pentapeptide-transferase